MSKAMTYLTIFLGTYLFIVALAWFIQPHLTFGPDKIELRPEHVELSGVDVLEVKTPQTEKLLAWYVPAPEGRPTIVYFHGNGGGLAHRASRVEHLRNENYGVLLTTYAGYSGSSGTPNEATILADAKFWYDWLTREKKIKPENIILYGESLGTGVAVITAASNPVGALVLETPYSSLVDVGASRFPFLPVNWLMSNRFEAHKHIKKVNAPVFITHGDADRVIPIRFAKKLFDVAIHPKTATWIPGGNHNDLYSHGVWPHIEKFLNSVVRK